jgi:outer membrane protein OmpA-like peptidoglycan-associated protein/Tol biopolymer transport system component
MKRLYIAAGLLMMATTVLAQSKDTERADKLFARYEYVDAAREYEKLAEKGKADGYVYRQLGDAYYNMFNPEQASRWYALAIKTDQDAETHYRYAQMLKAQGQYDAANAQMRTFAQKAPQDDRAKAFMAEPNYVPKLLAKDKLYDLKALEGVNSEKSDFGPVLHQGKLYFTSARNGARKEYGWNEEPFLDIYSADYNPDGTLTNAAAVAGLNSQYHDGPVSITADGQTLYFASDSFREKDFERDKKNRLKLGRNNLYRATKDGERWTNITRLPFSTNDHSTANPSISRDGKTLYFSSDMPGGKGGVDIWRVAVNPDGSFGTPENLGTGVNTPGNESFPFIADDNKTLFFASSGRQGLGGLDVFKADLSGNSPAQNLGKPVNTEKDDFSFTYDAEKDMGFFASNRNGNDDIFGATPVCGLQVITLVTDAGTGKILPGAKVAIVDDRRNVISTETADARGEVSYRVDCGKAYSVQASHPGYEGATFAVAAQAKGGETRIAAALQPIETIVTETEVVLQPIFFEFDKHNITREGAFELDKLIEAMNRNPEMVIMVGAHTDNRGSDAYNMALSDRRAKSTVQYVVSKGIAKSRITGKGYGETQPKVACDECTEEQHAQNRRSEFLIVKK